MAKHVASHTEAHDDDRAELEALKCRCEEELAKLTNEGPLTAAMDAGGSRPILTLLLQIALKWLTDQLAK